MNKEYSSQAILLNHRSMKEADKILYFITPNYGKVIIHAKSIKKIKSKLSGGISQLSLSHIEYREWKEHFFILTASSSLSNYNISDLDVLNSCFEIMAILLKTVAENQDAAAIFFAYILALEQFETYPQYHTYIKDIFLLRLFSYLSLVHVESLDQELSTLIPIHNWSNLQDFYHRVLVEKDIYMIPEDLIGPISDIIKFFLEQEIGFSYLKKL